MGPSFSRLSKTVVLFSVIWAVSLAASTGSAAVAELLTNAGFEAGTAGWSGVGISPSDCAGHSGPGAAALSHVNNGFLQQTVAVSAGGAYVFSGWSRLQAGSGTAKAVIRWLDSTSSTIGDVSVSIALGVNYASFSVLASAPAPAWSAQVRVETTSPNGSAVVCVDDLSLSGPLPSATTPVPSPSAAPLSPSSTAKSATASPTRTPTSTPPPTARSGPTGQAGGTPGAAGYTGEFINGGFESGLTGWQKVGGELSLVSSPTHSGSGAAKLTSATTSTKWAYEAVTVVPGAAYEFNGYAAPAGGVAEAFLRISWYESSDGSGRALGTTDSTARLNTNDGSFGFLTTGSVAAPAEAHSARLRAMLAPVSAAPATVYLDDFSFGPASAPPRAAVASVEEDAEPTASAATPRIGTSAASGDSPSVRPEGSPAPRTETQTAAQTTPRPAGPETASLPAEEAGSGSQVILWALAATGLFAVGLGGAILYSRRAR